MGTLANKETPEEIVCHIVQIYLTLCILGTPKPELWQTMKPQIK